MHPFTATREVENVSVSRERIEKPKWSCSSFWCFETFSLILQHEPQILIEDKSFAFKALTANLSMSAAPNLVDFYAPNELVTRSRSRYETNVCRSMSGPSSAQLLFAKCWVLGDNLQSSAFLLLLLFLIMINEHRKDRTNDAGMKFSEFAVRSKILSHIRLGLLWSLGHILCP